MPTASILLRDSLVYRRAAFAAGLEHHGYSIDFKHSRSPRVGDILVLWNRPRGYEQVAQTYEQRGCKVIIAENGYLPGPSGEKSYALALYRHNGCGHWHVGPEPRRTFDVQPWRKDGDFLLLLPQRGIGSRNVAMPVGWLKDALHALKRVTDRPIRIRKHPGGAKSDPVPDMAGAWACVTWGSGAAIKAIVAGVPVFYGLKNWIGGPAAKMGFDDIEVPYLGDRSEMLHRLSWAQWSAAEIESGEAFGWLLG